MAFYRVKKNKLWIWKAFDRTTGELIDWELGSRDSQTLERLMERLRRWPVEVYCTDDWVAYEKGIEEQAPASHHVISKSETVAIERNNSDNRHWFGRFHRRSKIISKSREMVELTMGLFAKFHVNGTPELLRRWRMSLLT